MVPTPVVGAKPDCLDNVGVVQALGDAVLGLDLLLVLFLCLLLSLGSELLDCIKLIRAPLSAHHSDLGSSTLSKMFAMAAKLG